MKIVEKPAGDAGNYADFPWRAVLHTTQGVSLPGYSGNNPHATLDVWNEVMYQHCDWHKASRALLHPAGTIETNRARAVQFEIIAFHTVAAAREAAGGSHKWDKFAVPSWGDEQYKFIHRALVHAQHQGCDFKLLPATPWEQVRFSDEKWRHFNGVCGHMHVPHNDHMDPGGAFRAKRIK